MKRLFTILAALALVILCATLLPTEAQAAEIVKSGTCGENLTWTLDDAGTLTISGTGAMTNYTYYSSAPWYSSRTSVKTVVIEDGVTSIGDRAFYSCTSLTSVTIPDSVTSIGSYAFYYCTSLTSITIPDSVTSIGEDAFYYCTGLTSVIIPDSVTSIGNYAFEYCYSLTSITIPDSVTSIGNSAFSSCDSLTYNIYGNAKYLGNANNPYHALIDTTSDSITSCQIHSDTKVIGGSAFYYCSSLPSVTIPNSVTSIGNSAFSYCSSLTSVTIPNSVTSIGNSAFYYCTRLTSVTIPDSVTSIGNDAFSSCTSLTSVTIPDSVTSIGSYAFCECSSLTSVTIPDSVTDIADYAFAYCYSLTSVTIPDSVTSIGFSAFRYCDSLTSVAIPDSVTSIGSYAFKYCDSLTSVTYCGTEEQWNQIIIGDDNYDLTNATLSYHNYVDGTCTICGEADPSVPVDPEQVDALNFDKIAFNLGAKIGVQFALNNNLVVAGGYENAYVKVSMPMYNEDGTYFVEEFILTEGQVAGKYLVFIYGAAPKLMGREMTVQAFAEKNGQVYCGEIRTYSLKQGIMDLLASNYSSSNDTSKSAAARQKAYNRCVLLVDMLYYGAEAQIRFEQSIFDGVVTDGLDAKYVALKTTTAPVFAAPPTEVSKKENELYGLSLGVADAVELQFTFTLTEGEHEKYTVKVTCAGVDYIYTSEDFQYAYTAYPNRATVICSELAAKQMRDEVTVVLLKDGVQVSKTYTTSIESAAKVMGTNINNKNYALARAMMTYGDSAKVCFG